MDEDRTISEIPFRIALLGDWSGRANRGSFEIGADWSERGPVSVTRDNLDDVMAALDVKVHLNVDNDPDAPLEISFKELDDFHPDSIFNRLLLFEELKDLRSQLVDSEKFAAAADRVRALTKYPERDSPTSFESEKPADGNQGLLDQILSRAADSETPSERQPPYTSPEIRDLVKDAMKPYMIPASQLQSDELVAALDTYTGHKMNTILHHPDFQSLEGAWRGLHLLVSRLDLGTELQLYLLDVSKAELGADLKAASDPHSSQLYKAVVEDDASGRGDAPWALISTNYTFEAVAEDAELLERLSLLAMSASAPVVSAASPHFIGCESFGQARDPDDWKLAIDPNFEAKFEALKDLESASYLGLALPRFLLRLPYGKDTNPTEEFQFEEMPTGVTPPHESYLWANPSFAVTCLVGEAFNRNGWKFVPRDLLELDGLPLHVHRQDGEAQIKPCAEILMTVRGAEKIIDQGLIPLISLKHKDSIRLGSFQSLAKKSLAEHWRSS
ncbi:MAG TPA: type VI secretion system contractile sheath large subunit [Pyrinomonadaceae bacterium]